MANSNLLKIVIVILSIATILLPSTNGTTHQRKLDDTNIIKCGCSSCTPCILSSPPPPPPYVVYSPPPPKKPPTPSKDCPPPPMKPFSPSIFVPGPPGNLYPTDTFYSGSHQRNAKSLAMVILCGFTGAMMAYW